LGGGYTTRLVRANSLNTVLWSCREHLGVRLRVEIGPGELKTRTCVVSKSNKPGDYQDVQRKKGVDADDDFEILEVLKEFGNFTDLKIGQGMKAGASGTKRDAAAKRKRAADGDEEEDEEDLGSKKTSKLAKLEQKKAKKAKAAVQKEESEEEDEEEREDEDGGDDDDDNEDTAGSNSKATKKRGSPQTVAVRSSGDSLDDGFELDPDMDADSGENN
jgi:hypothetical protein